MLSTVVDKVISNLVVDGGAPMAVAVTKGEGVAASDEGQKWVPKSLGQLTLMCLGLSGFAFENLVDYFI